MLIYLLILMVLNNQFFATVFANEVSENLSERVILKSQINRNKTIELAKVHNFKFIDTVVSDDSEYYIFELNPEISKRDSLNSTLTSLASVEAISKHPNITSAQREQLLERTKRDFVDHRFHDDLRTQTIPLALGYSSDRKMDGRVTRVSNKSPKYGFGHYTENDPMWPYLWYMNRHSFNKNLTDMNITSAWVQGYSGKGVAVTFLDDGIEWDHPDIIQNYDPKASFDFNNNDADPMPRYDKSNENKHGTRCAGEVAATGNNSICSIGIAYNAGVGGIRMLDGPITDSLEAKSLSLNNQYVSIYSASWGPTDNGQKLDGPDRFVKQALKNGAIFGRNGLGSIFTWASGNGGIYGDSCACDGYVNSIYTFSISSTTDQETKPWYLEECTSILATTYSSGDTSRGQQPIATTDLRHKCTKSHTATSAAAPIAAGIIALTLEANPNLTWRDVMFIIVLTSRPKVIRSNNYFQNKAGFLVSSRYGFGLMDAGRMVEVAKKWITVPEFHTCHANKTKFKSKRKKFNQREVFVETNGCAGTPHEVIFIEQVEVIVSLRTAVRGHIELYLTSPMGSRTKILQKRPKDRSSQGLKRWAFMTVQLWGESPHGEWKLEVTRFYGSTYSIDDFELRIHGTKERPAAYNYYHNNNN